MLAISDASSKYQWPVLQSYYLYINVIEVKFIRLLDVHACKLLRTYKVMHVPAGATAVDTAAGVAAGVTAATDVVTAAAALDG
jgi:hypothetical protein